MQKYLVKIVPDIPENSLRLLDDILQASRNKLSLIFGSFTLHNGGWTLYSKSEVKEPVDFRVTFEEQNYQVKISWAAEVAKNSVEYFVFLKALFNSLLKLIR